MKIIEEQYAWRGELKPDTPNAIVIHHAAATSCTAQDIHKWHIGRGWLGFAYHYFIRKNGFVYRGRPENKRGGHLLSDENIGAIGICLEGNYDIETPPEIQLKALKELISDIKTRWNIKSIKRHADYPSAQKNNKLCPGRLFPWERFGDDNMNLSDFQRAAQTVGAYKGKIDGITGPYTRAAAQEFLPIIQQVLGLPDLTELQLENVDLKTRLSKIETIAKGE